MIVNQYKKYLKPKYIIVLVTMIVLGFILLTTNIRFIGKRSIHDDALRYSNRHCLVFYPDTKKGAKIAKEICQNEKNFSIYDYTLVPYGDYYLVNYANGYSYYIDEDFNDVEIGKISNKGKEIISDYLKFTLKKQNPDFYYNSKNILSLYWDKLDFSNVTYELIKDYLKCYFPEYECEFEVPLKYLQKELSMNFGYSKQLYSKPVYIDDNHPVIAFSFDDGPQLWVDKKQSSTVQIVDSLYKYDATATFYVVGDCLEERNVWDDFEVYNLLKNSINHGNEYGSHTNDHSIYLTERSSAESIRKAIEEPGLYIKDFIGYDVKTYRPTGGLYDDDVLDAQPYPAILWNVDSDDWDIRDAKAIYDKVINTNLETGDVILFHDIYDSTSESIEMLLPELIDKGYQIVSVSQLLKYLDIDINTLTYYFSPIYYE